MPMRERHTRCPVLARKGSLRLYGAKHTRNHAIAGFTNPEADANGKKYGLPLAYSEETDRQSWQEMQKFFIEIFA